MQPPLIKIDIEMNIQGHPNSTGHGSKGRRANRFRSWLAPVILALNCAQGADAGLLGFVGCQAGLAIQVQLQCAVLLPLPPAYAACVAGIEAYGQPICLGILATPGQ
jgi:hypothetical protein